MCRSSSVVTLRVSPVSVCVAVTVTPGSTAPLSSVTRPLNWAVESCAQAEVVVSRTVSAPTRVMKDRIVSTPSVAAWTKNGADVTRTDPY